MMATSAGKSVARAGTTDDLGLSVAENPVTVHDLHATILHLLGFDDERLTFRHAGRRPVSKGGTP